jgi:NADH-quinone oxidoreductase subunit G
LRVLANLLAIPDFDFESSQEVLKRVPGLPVEGDTLLSDDFLKNTTQAAIDLTPAAVAPAVVGIYALDGIVRRAASLQLTADAKPHDVAQEVTA